MAPIPMTDERRTNERAPWECHARLLPLSLEAGTPRVSMQAVTGRNISEGGVQVCSDRSFAIRSKLLVEMELPSSPEGIQAVGSVAWISPTTSDDRWWVGIEFSDVGVTALNGIRHLMHQSDEHSSVTGG